MKIRKKSSRIINNNRFGGHFKILLDKIIEVKSRTKWIRLLKKRIKIKLTKSIRLCCKKCYNLQRKIAREKKVQTIGKRVKTNLTKEVLRLVSI